MNWEKRSEKLYTIRIDDKLTDIFCPYAKVEALFTAFIGSGGMIDAEGKVQTDVLSMIKNFSVVGNILLTQYGPKGSIVEEGDCSQLSQTELMDLFAIATDIVTGFISNISKMQTMEMEPEKEKSAKKTKTP